MDGPVIQEASQAALETGATPASVLSSVPKLDTGVPHAVMTYYNLAHHPGHERLWQRWLNPPLTLPFFLTSLG